MAESVINSFFPSQIASDQEKMSSDYGLRVGRAIQDEWFKSDSGTNRFRSNQNTFHRLRLYARGEQGIQKYKDELYLIEKYYKLAWVTSYSLDITLKRNKKVKVYCLSNRFNDLFYPVVKKYYQQYSTTIA